MSEVTDADRAPARLRWSPRAGALPEAAREGFQRYSLERETSQLVLLLAAFGWFCALMLGVDLVMGATPWIALNAFLLLLAATGALLVHRNVRRGNNTLVLSVIANGFGFLLISALLVAKTSTTPDQWFVYFADLLVITGITLYLPIHMFTKLAYCACIVVVDVIAVSASGFPADVISGVSLILIAALAFSNIVYLKMQQAHFDAWHALGRERDANAELREAMQQVRTLGGLLPICANCKKVRDDNGYWDQLDHYIEARTDVAITHGICPECTETLYPEHYTAPPSAD